MKYHATVAFADIKLELSVDRDSLAFKVRLTPQVMADATNSGLDRRQLPSPKDEATRPSSTPFLSKPVLLSIWFCQFVSCSAKDYPKRNIHHRPLPLAKTLSDEAGQGRRVF
jgi:hypothetical protein